MRIGLFTVDLLAASAEQQGDAPKTSQANQGINDSTKYGTLASKQPCNQVKLKNAHKTPVERTDDNKNQTNFIEHLIQLLLLLI